MVTLGNDNEGRLMTQTAATLSAVIVETGGDLAPVSAQIMLDDNWQPYAQITLVCALTAETSERLIELDPRDTLHARMTVTQDYGWGEPAAALTGLFRSRTAAAVTAAFNSAAELTARFWHNFDPAESARVPAYTREFLLLVRRRTVDYLNETASLELASDDAALMDYSRVSGESVFYNNYWFIDTVIAVLALTNRVLTGNFNAGGALIADPATAEWKPGVSAMDYLTEGARAANGYLFADELGRWFLTANPRNQKNGNGPELDRHTLSYDADLTDISDDFSRDGEWFTAAVFTYNWETSDGVQHTYFETYEDPAYAPKVMTRTFERPPWENFNFARIAVIVAGRRGRVRTLAGPADVTLFAGRRLEIIPRNGPAYVEQIGAIGWEYPAGTMTISPRINSV